MWIKKGGKKARLRLTTEYENTTPMGLIIGTGWDAKARVAIARVWHGHNFFSGAPACRPC